MSDEHSEADKAWAGRAHATGAMDRTMTDERNIIDDMKKALPLLESENERRALSLLIGQVEETDAWTAEAEALATAIGEALPLLPAGKGKDLLVSALREAHSRAAERVRKA